MAKIVVGRPKAKVKAASTSACTPAAAPVAERKHGELVIPKSIAACGDLLYTIRDQRLELEHRAEELKKDEARLREHLINAIPKDDATGVRGRIAQVTVSVKPEPTVKNWSSVWAYIKKRGAFDMLQKRLNTSAVKARWDEGEEIPGIEAFDVVTVNCTKLGGK